jgi:hypothetical protein
VPDLSIGLDTSRALPPAELFKRALRDLGYSAKQVEGILKGTSTTVGAGGRAHQDAAVKVGAHVRAQQLVARVVRETGVSVQAASRVVRAFGTDMDRAEREAAQMARAVDAAEHQVRELAAAQRQAAGSSFSQAVRQQSAALSALKAQLGLLLGVGGLLALKRGVEDVVGAYQTQIKSEAQIEARLASTQNAIGLTADEFFRYAKEIQRSTGIGDEAIQEQEGVLLSFTRITKENFRGALEAAIDMAKGLGKDIPSQVLAMGKALDDGEQGLTALRRSGTIFTDEQEELIKSLYDTGNAAEAQRLVIAEVQRQYGGTAKAIRDAIGPSEALGAEWGDLKEKIGGLIYEEGGLRDFQERLLKLYQAINEDFDSSALAASLRIVIDLVGDMAQIVGAAIEQWRILGALLLVLAARNIPAVISAIQALIARLALLGAAVPWLTAIAAALYAVGKAAEYIRDRYAAEIDRITESTRRWRDEQDKLTAAIESGSRAVIEAETATWAAKEAAAAAALSDAWFKIAGASQALAEAQAKLDAAQSQGASGANTLGGEINRARTGYDGLKAAVDDARAALEVAKRAQGEATAEDRTATEALGRLKEALAKVGHGEAAALADKQAKALAHLVEALDKATRSALAHAKEASSEADTLYLGARAAAAIAKELEIQGKVQDKLAEATAKGVAGTKAFQGALEAFEQGLRNEATAEEYLAGKATLDRLGRAIEAEKALLAVASKGTLATRAEAEQQAILSEQLEATVHARDDQVDAIKAEIAQLHALRIARQAVQGIIDLRDEVQWVERENAARAEGLTAYRAFLDQKELEVELRKRVVTGLPVEIAFLTLLIKKRQEEQRAGANQETLDNLDAELAGWKLQIDVLQKAIDKGLDYAAAMREVAIAVRTAQIARENPGLDPDAIRVKVAAAYDAEVQFGRLEERAKATTTTLTKFTNGLQGLGEVLSGMDEPLAAFAFAASDMVSAFETYRKAMKGVEKGSAEAGAAMDGLTQSISGAVAAAVVSYATPILAGGGTSQFGGEMGGTYAAEGAQIGESFGGAWGAFAGMVIGSFFETASDKMDVAFSSAADSTVSSIRKADGELSKIAASIVQSVEAFYEALTRQLGGLRLDIGDVDISIDENLVTVVVDGYKQVFRSLDEALAWSAEQVLMANKDAAGLGENMRALFSGLDPLNVSGSFQDLADAIDLARRMDDRLAGSLYYLTEQREREMDLARQYGLDQTRALEMARERLALVEKEIGLGVLQFAGVSTIVGSYQELVAQMDAYDEQLDREKIALENRAQAILDEIAAIKARGEDLGLEGGVVNTDDIMRWRQEARESGLTFAEFTRTLGENEQAAIRDYEMLQRLEAEYAAIAKQLGMTPEKFTEAYRAMVQEIARIAETSNVLGMMASFWETWGQGQTRAAEFRRREDELKFRAAQLAIQLAVIQLIANAELLGLTHAQINQYKRWAAEVAGATYQPGAGLRGGRRQQGAADAAATALDDWNARLAAMADVIAGVSSQEQALAKAREDLIASGEAAGRTTEEIAAGLSLLARIQIADITAPWLEMVRAAGESDAQTAYRHAGEAAAQALAEAAAAATGDPDLYEQARQAIEAGLGEQLRAIGRQVLGGLGGERAQANAGLAQFLDALAFLQEHGAELGITFRDIAQSVRDSILPGLLEIAIAEAERVGDTAAANALRAEADALERVFLIAKLVIIRQELEAAGLLTDHWAHVIDRTIERTGEADAAVGELTVSEEELARQRQEMADGIYGQIESLARAAGVELPVEMAREWAQVQYALARAELLVALSSQEVLDAFALMPGGLDRLAEWQDFVLNMPDTLDPVADGLDRVSHAADRAAHAVRHFVVGVGLVEDGAEGAGRSLAEIIQGLLYDAMSPAEKAAEDWRRFQEEIAAATGSEAERLEAMRLGQAAYYAALQRLQDEAWGGVNDLLDELTSTGALGVSPGEQLRTAQADLAGMAQRAAAGDLEAAAGLDEQAQRVLDLLSQIYGGRALAEEAQQVLDLLTGARAAAGAAPQNAALAAFAAGPAPLALPPLPPAGLSAGVVQAQAVADLTSVVGALQTQTAALTSKMEGLTTASMRQQGTLHGSLLGAVRDLRPAPRPAPPGARG